MDRRVAAIDLGSTKVVTLVGEETPAGVRIIAYNEAPSKGIVKGEIINIQNVLDSLKPTIEQTNLETGSPVSSIITGIAGQNIKCDTFIREKKRRSPSDLITESEIEELRREMFNTRVESGETILHVIPQSYNVDDHINVVEPVGMTGATIEGNYLLFIGKKSSTEGCNTVISRSGLKLERTILEPIASARAVLTDDEKEVGVALVDMGGATTDLIIIKDNIIRYAAIVPFAGNSITEDIKQALGVPLKYAELMKVHFGSCFSGYAEENKSIVLSGADGAPGKHISLKKLSEIIEARVSEILATINYEIEKSGFANKIPSGLVLTGGSSNLAYIRHLAKAITGHPIRLAKPLHTITDDSVEKVYQPAASTAVGLALMGFEYLHRGDEEPVSFNYEVEEEPSTNQATGSGFLFEEKDIKSDREREKERKREKEMEKKKEKERREREKEENRAKRAGNESKSNKGGIFGGIFDIFDSNDNEV